jgi:hypothetical protein
MPQQLFKEVDLYPNEPKAPKVTWLRGREATGAAFHMNPRLLSKQFASYISFAVWEIFFVDFFQFCLIHGKDRVTS